MGLGSISPWSLLLILVIMMLLFGTKRLRSIGSDLGAGMRSLKRGFEEDDSDINTTQNKSHATTHQREEKGSD